MTEGNADGRAEEADNMKHKGCSAGFALVETLIASLLMAVVVVSVFSIALTSRLASKKTSKKQLANYYSTKVREQLKAYVTSDLALTTAGLGAFWKLPADSCAGCPGAPTCWALAVCTHDVSSLLPAACTAGTPLCSGAPVNATLKYTVTNDPVACVGPDCRKHVDVKVDWTE